MSLQLHSFWSLCRGHFFLLAIESQHHGPFSGKLSKPIFLRSVWFIFQKMALQGMVFVSFPFLPKMTINLAEIKGGIYSIFPVFIVL